MNPQIKEAITENYKIKNDRQIGKMFGLSPNTIRGYRFQLGLTSNFIREAEKNKEIIARIIELFIAEVPMKRIAKSFKKSDSTISYIITKHYFFKQRSYNTITLVMDSKINYE